MARGRDVIERYSFLLDRISKAVGVLPKRAQITMLEASRPVPWKIGFALRYILLRSILKECGKNVIVYENAYLKEPGRLEIGNNVTIHPMCYFDATGGLSIGTNVSIAHGVTIMTTEHNYAVPDMPIREAPLSLSTVDIGSDVWIGAGVKVLAGVRIGSRCVIGAGAVVTRDVPDNSVAVGVPAKVLRHIGLHRSSSTTTGLGGQARALDNR